jgi:hypothetical protein
MRTVVRRRTLAVEEEHPMINGAHVILYSTNADADRAFLKDTLKLAHVDVGHGWLIFALPPAEIAVHPGATESHELFLMCDDVNALVRDMTAKGIACSPVTDQRWGLLTELTLPGGGKLGVYEPRHARPKAKAGKAPAKRATKKAKRAGKTASSKAPAGKKPRGRAKASVGTRRTERRS